MKAELNGVRARSVIIDNSETSFGLTADWRLDRNWVSRSLLLTLVDAAGDRSLKIERAGPSSWVVDGQRRPDLDGCAEIDVSATPFCNGLALRRLGHQPGELTALYVLAPALSVEPSRQRYERVGDNWRYVDLVRRRISRPFSSSTRTASCALTRGFSKPSTKARRRMPGTRICVLCRRPVSLTSGGALLVSARANGGLL